MVVNLSAGLSLPLHKYFTVIQQYLTGCLNNKNDDTIKDDKNTFYINIL